VEGGERRQIERANQYRPENFDLPSGSRSAGTTAIGRWPANLIHDGSEEVTGLFPDAGGGYGVRGGRAGATVGDFGMGATMETVGFGDSGSAARFFYTAKADKSDRGPGNNHPTVKPVDLMRYLVRLVCPIGGVVLDPFSGSGTTLAAAQAEGCLAIGVEREAAYCEIIKGRFHQRRLF
jgi:site-specific DNA-methyltransferase (adenine-specific)